MTDLKTSLSEAVGAAFAAEGVDKALARVTASDRPDLADFQSNGALAAAKALKETKYDGTPVVVMIASDLEAPRVASQILADRLARAGFKVDAQMTDWATLRARRTQRTGWSVYGVHALGLDLASPLTNSVINFNCTSAATAGFMCDERMVPLFDAFARAPTREAQREVAGQAEQILVMAGQAAADHVRHHADMEGRLLDDVQRQLHLDAGAAALAGGALLGAAAVDALEPGRADETGSDGVRVLADDAVGAHPAGLVLALHGRMERVQAVTGDPLGAWVAADDVAHAWASWVRWGCRFITAPPPVRAWHSVAWPPPR